MEQIISKEELEELIKIEGKTMGNSIKNSGEFILREEGEEGLKKLEDAMSALGYPIRYREIKATSFYPSNLLAITFVTMKRLFSYDDKKFQEMGEFRAKFSLIIRLFMRYFVSIDKAAKALPIIWRKLFTTGDARVVELNKEARYAIKD